MSNDREYRFIQNEFNHRSDLRDRRLYRNRFRPENGELFGSGYAHSEKCFSSTFRFHFNLEYADRIERGLCRGQYRSPLQSQHG